LCTAAIHAVSAMRPRPSSKITRCNEIPIVNGQELLFEEDGPTAVEYAVMLALIIVVCIVAVRAIGTSASSTFQNVATNIQNASS
jgi:pilus assembly protein Flp/PilA